MLCGKPVSPPGPVLLQFWAHCLWNYWLTGDKQRALSPVTPPLPLPLRPISWALLPLQFTAQSGVNRDTLHHLSHCWVGCVAQAARLSIKAGPPENSRMPAPPASPPLPALLWSPAKEGSLPTPPLAICTSLNVTGRWSKRGLFHPPHHEETTCLLSTAGKIHRTFFHKSHAISKSSAATVPLRVRDSQALR